jgi:hypothetical protein
MKIPNAHLSRSPNNIQIGNWRMKAAEPGELEIREICNKRIVHPAEGELQFKMIDIRE